MEGINIKLNKYQSPLNEELRQKLPKEVWDDILEYTTNIKFIHNLIKPDREYISDRPVMTYINNDGEEVEYEDGRKLVNLTEPHILENMDFFRERALFFKKHGKYTNIIPNANPKSDYALFWKEELRRWKYGLIRDDGEWITGELYFYWNYSPIPLSEQDEGSKSSKRAERVRGFPRVWLGDYLFYHYIDQARERGSHGKLLKTRGVGFLEPNTSILQQSTGTIKVGDVKVGDMLLDRYGNDTKVLEVYPQGKQDIYEVTFMDGRTVKCGKDHLWSVYDKNKGSKNKDKLYTYKTSDLIEKGLYWKNNSGNKLYKFYVPDLAEPVKYKEQDLFISPYILGALLGDGSMSTKSIKIASDDIEVINKIQKDLGDDYILTKDSTNNNYRIVYKHLYENGHIRTNPLKKHLVNNKWNFTTSSKRIPDIYKYSSYEQRLELVKGLMDTDGSISKNGNLEFSNSNKALIDDLASILRSMGISCTKGLGRKPRQKEIKGKLCNIKQEFRLYIRTNIDLFYIKRKSDRVRNKKIFLNNAIVSIKNLNYSEESTCFLVDNTEHLYLTNDFIPTHNSLKTASWSPRNMYVFPGSQNPNFHLASEKSFLTGDKGIWGKILDTLDWIATNTPLPRMRLVDKKQAMEVQLGYEDEYGSRKGLLSSVFGISLKDNPDKARGVRGPLIHYEEDGLFPNLEKAWGVNRKAVEDGGVAFGFMLAGGCLTKNNLVWTKSGKLLPINEITKEDGILGYDGKVAYKEEIGWFKEPQKKECVRITTSGGDFIECSIDHPILWTKNQWRKIKTNKGKKTKLGKICTFKNAGDINVGDQLLKIDNINIFGNKYIKDARLYGLMIGDGNLSKNASPSLSCDSDDIFNYIKDNYNYTVSKEFKTKKGNIYRQLGLSRNGDIFKESTINNLVKLDKKLPSNIDEYDKKSLSELIGGYFDADGNVYYNKKRNKIRICLTSISKKLLKEVKYQLIKFGIHSNISKEFRKKGYNPNSTIYRLYISGYEDVKRFKDNISLLSQNKQDTLNKIDSIKWIDRNREKNYYFKLGSNKQGQYFVNRNQALTNTRHESVSKVEFIGKQTIYNLHTTHSNTYLANNFITKQTGGVEGKSFAGSEKLFYNPVAYNIYGIPNVFDKNADGNTICGFFWGAYMNRNNCYDLSNGEPDIIKALVEICLDRYEVKYNSSDASAITQKKAEEPITPQEAIMRTEGTLFPVSDLKEHLEEISVNRESFLAEHLVGDLVYTSNGTLEFKNFSDKYPLRSYDITSADKSGNIEIFELPKKNGEGIITRGRYIAGIDPIDADKGQSLFSMMVMDTFTDRIVAEYSGRPRTANEAYDIALRLLKFYNAEANYESNLKGLFSYFDKHNALHYLCNTPQILKDMELTKATNLYGNLAKGTNANQRINTWGRQLQADWMLKPVNENASEGDADYGRLNLHTLRGLAYLEECIKWNSDGNFDRVSAGGMLFILREDRYKRTISAKANDINPRNDIANDKFFTKNFKSKGNIGMSYEQWEMMK